MKTLPICLGFTRASERELADAFHAMADRHSRDFEIRQGCMTFVQWSEAHLKTLERFTDQHGVTINSDPARVHSSLFHGMRIGGYGLLRDLQDLLLLAHQARTSWTAIAQAAKELKDADMAQVALDCGSENDRQIDWLCTHIKLTAPHALTVPPQLGDEAKASLPKTPTPAALQEIGWSPLAAGFSIAVVGAISLLAKQPWLLPSLGPTAYLVAETPHHPNSRFYNTVVGHIIGLGAGFFAVMMFDAWADPTVLSDRVLTAARFGAAVVAIILTLLFSLFSKASHPPAAATTLLVALGSLKSTSDALNVVIGAVLIGAVGTGVRLLRTKAVTKKEQQAEVLSSGTLFEPTHVRRTAKVKPV